VRTMLGFKDVEHASITITGRELAPKVKKK
jgi:hypothetical protein